ncbi:activating signal cointegrator 1 complex subunit 2 [Coccinella septempunctata]|uniref:activating signal cointegrator 1 complex subunit 2 n=1 Tax=Coccinella septempunctata TaxID=41139 RepID=UPI001D085A42|nr:activating signal cointegrator 1 complex subunit 2 [Coccinella septempunctata]
MNKLADIFGEFSLNTVENDSINYSYFDFFKNPHKLPINEVYIERKRYELDKSSLNKQEEAKSDKNKKKCVTMKKEVIPALHESWLPRFIPAFEFQEYNFSIPEEDNIFFNENNKNYLFFLEYLIRSSYHQFWCSVLFKENVQDNLREFMLHPIPVYLYNDLGKECQKVYKEVFNKFYLVVRRLIVFRESETEYMPANVGAKYLVEKKLLNLSIALTITLLYVDFDNELINELSDIYFSLQGQQKFIEKEVEHYLKEFILISDTIRGRITGKFDPGIVPVPISLEDRPKIFSLPWVNSVVNYCLNMISTLSSLFRLRSSTVEVAYQLNVPENLAKNYDGIFNDIYEMLESRRESIQDDGLYKRIMEKIGYARIKFVDNFHNFISFILEKTISLQGKSKEQEEYLEMFIDTMSAALEYEIFICDYNHKYPVSQTVEMFEDFSQIDKTRTDYIITSLNSLERNDFIKDKFSIESAFVNLLPKSAAVKEPQPSCSSTYEPVPGTSKEWNDVDEKIQSITSIFPHLGEGFVEMCLKHFDFNTNQVVQAILEENIPPHLLEVAFDTPRIPPEPEPPKPTLAYRGKKPGFDDALSMLNDKKEKEKMKTLVMDGIKYNNRYDNTDDEYDDRDSLLEPDFVVEHEVEKYEKRNEEELVSDTSYSDNEFDEEGKPVDKGDKTGFKAFCEDPAVVRARYEAKMRIRRGKTDVVGKPKGQGQEKKVVNARQKKNVQKSTRANHNRKGGASFKRNKGMIPS